MQKTIEKENYLKTLYKLEEKSQLATATSLADCLKWQSDSIEYDQKVNVNETC